MSILGDLSVIASSYCSHPIRYDFRDYIWLHRTCMLCFDIDHLYMIIFQNMILLLIARTDIKECTTISMWFQQNHYTHTYTVGAYGVQEPKLKIVISKLRKLLLSQHIIINVAHSPKRQGSSMEIVERVATIPLILKDWILMYLGELAQWTTIVAWQSTSSWLWTRYAFHDESSRAWQIGLDIGGTIFVSYEIICGIK